MLWRQPRTSQPGWSGAWGGGCMQSGWYHLGNISGTATCSWFENRELPEDSCRCPPWASPGLIPLMLLQGALRL